MKNSVQELRKARNLTQEALAEKCGVSRQTIIAIEQGRFNPSLPLAFAITRALFAKKIEDVFEG
ncbi:MAG: helix-turn-helix transcriptional regulator [Candidatus Micrarchaeia archaeon]